MQQWEISTWYKQSLGSLEAHNVLLKPVLVLLRMWFTCSPLMHTIITAISTHSKLKVYTSNKEGVWKGCLPAQCQNDHLEHRVHLVDKRRITCRHHPNGWILIILILLTLHKKAKLILKYSRLYLSKLLFLIVLYLIYLSSARSKHGCLARDLNFCFKLTLYLWRSLTCTSSVM